MNSRVRTTWKGRFEWGINNRENRAIVSCVHCTTMFPAAHRYRAESDRTNVANKVSCFPRERERGRGRWGGGEAEEHELVISKLRVTTVTIKRGGLWSTLGPETLCISLYEKSLLSAFHGILLLR